MSLSKINKAVQFMLLLSLSCLLVTSPNHEIPHSSSKEPLEIWNGPLGNIRAQATGTAYWFQVGAMGDSASSAHYYGANITIRTVFDRANNDAHSYWVGGYIANGAFIQVGYLTTVTTTGSPYCCAWFWEYFPASQTSCCSPHIGPEFSAGPIGSWHEYSMMSNNNGTWSFYIDNVILGTTPDLGASDSGNNAPAGMAEVADTANANDILGPAEFVNMTTYRAIGLGYGWQSVPRGLGFIDYGAPSARALPNPYGSVEVQAVSNDFLAGSGLPQPAAGQPPTTVFWPPTTSSPYAVALNFTDSSGRAVVPDWVDFHDSGNPQSRVFYTRYTDQLIAQAQGEWILDGAYWHNTNVSPLETISIGQFGAYSNNITLRVFPVAFHVIGYLYSYPVANARISTTLPDSVPVNVTSNSNGDGLFDQLPLGQYSVRVIVPRGIATTINPQFTSPANISVRVIGLPELLTVLIVPVALGVVVIVFALRKEQARKRAWKSMTSVPGVVPPSPPSPIEPPPPTTP